MNDDEIPTLIPADTAAVTLPEEDVTSIKVPITIVTGYLGAGKSTLLNYILTEEHSKKIAVILNGLNPLSFIYLDSFSALWLISPLIYRIW